MIYLGSYGKMIPVKCPSSQEISHGERYSFEDTLEGKRKAQTRPLARREWDLQMSEASSPTDIASLAQFAEGAWGKGPFWFVSTDAPHTNLLTPAGSFNQDLYQANSVDAGPMFLGAEGWAPRSTSNSRTSEIYAQYERVPVLRGVPVVGSAFVEGAGAVVRLYWTDDSDSVVGAVNSDQAVGSSPQRLVVVGTPPATASGVRLVVVGSSRFTRPALTWDKLHPWSDGQGCPRAVVHGFGRSLVLTGKNQTYSSARYKITEVG